MASNHTIIMPKEEKRIKKNQVMSLMDTQAYPFLQNLIIENRNP